MCKGKLMFSAAAAILGDMACERDQENQMLTQSLDTGIIQPTLNLLCEK